MEMTVKNIDDEMYQVICGWWKNIGAPQIPRNILPRRGYAVFSDKPIIAGFLYKDETADFWMLEWITADPDSTPEERAICVPELIAHVRKVAKEGGAMFVYTTGNHPKLIEKLRACGFKTDCEGITQLFLEV